MTSITILWIYIGLLIAGGLVGFLKAGSKVSIIASVAFAIPLALCASGVIHKPVWVADAILGFLVVFFGGRFAKSKKFMPGGMMAVLSVVVLAARFLMK